MEIDGKEKAILAGVIREKKERNITGLEGGECCFLFFSEASCPTVFLGLVYVWPCM